MVEVGGSLHLDCWCYFRFDQPILGGLRDLVSVILNNSGSHLPNPKVKQVMVCSNLVVPECTSFLRDVCPFGNGIPPRKPFCPADTLIGTVTKF